MKEIKSAFLLITVVVVLVVAGASWYFMRSDRKPAQEREGETAHEPSALPPAGGRLGLEDLTEEAQVIQSAMDRRVHIQRCFNNLDGSRNSALEVYYSWFRPTVTDRSVHNLHIRGLDDCRKLLERNTPDEKIVMAEISEMKALDRETAAYVEGVETIADILERMKVYQAGPASRDLKYPKGAELHFELMRVLKDVNPGAHRIENLLDESLVALGTRRLDYFRRKYGESTRYYMMRARLAADRFIDLVKRKEPVVGELESALGELSGSLRTLALHVKENENEMTSGVFEKYPGAAAGVRRFLAGGETLVESGNSYIRSLKVVSADPDRLEHFIRQAFSKGPHAPGTELLNTYTRKVEGSGMQIPW